MRSSGLFLQRNVRKVLQYRVRSNGKNSRHCLQVPTCRLQGTHCLAGSVQIVLVVFILLVTTLPGSTCAFWDPWRGGAKSESTWASPYGTTRMICVSSTLNANAPKEM